MKEKLMLVYIKQTATSYVTAITTYDAFCIDL